MNRTLNGLQLLKSIQQNTVVRFVVTSKHLLGARYKRACSYFEDCSVQIKDELSGFFSEERSSIECTSIEPFQKMFEDVVCL